MNTQPARHIPAPITRFIGRVEELRQIPNLLVTNRLLTLTGPGGCGKTRLGIEALSALQARFKHRIGFIELAPVCDGDQVIRTIAHHFGLREEAGAGLLPALTTHLRVEEFLLLLDNCEHVITQCAALVDHLLRNCPGLHIIATSRESLGIVGEVILPVTPLQVAEGAADQLSLPALLQMDAIRLFVERAQAAAPEFDLTDENKAAIVEICRQVDGIPLAIELAASRIKYFPPNEMARRLQDRFGFLTQGARHADPRQQTLWSAIAWSYNLLSEDERKLWTSLCVCEGGFSLDAAEAIGRGIGMNEERVLQLLAQLIDKSLVALVHRPITPRYRMLATIQAFGRFALQEAGLEQKACEQHLYWCLRVAERHTELLGGRVDSRVPRLAEEIENMRAALRWCAQAGYGEAGMRLALALMPYWGSEGSLAEARHALLKFVQHVPDGALKARGLHELGCIATVQGESAQAERLQREALQLWQGAADRQGIARASTNLAILAERKGERDQAVLLHEQALMIWEELCDHRNLASSLVNLGVLEAKRGNETKAHLLYERSLALMLQSGNRTGAATVLHNLGQLAATHGDFAQADRLFEESQSLLLQERDRWRLAILFSSRGKLAEHQQDRVQAADWYRQSLATAHELGAREGIAEALEGLLRTLPEMPTWERVRIQGVAQALRAALTPSADLQPEAIALLDQAVHAALQISDRPGRRTALPTEASCTDLSARQLEITRLVAQGQTDRQIGSALFISPRTVDSHLRRIFAQVRVSSRAELAAWAVRNGLA